MYVYALLSRQGINNTQEVLERRESWKGREGEGGRERERERGFFFCPIQIYISL